MGGSGAEMVSVPSLAIELVTLCGSTPRGSEKLCEMFLMMFCRLQDQDPI